MRKIKIKHIISVSLILTTFALTFVIYKKYNKREKVINENISGKKIFIQPPLKSMDVSYDEYSIYTDSTTVIERNTGTQLKIPASCFQRVDGSNPSEIITLKVREFHNPVSILQAGIPMEVAGSNGKYLESAGMIEMHAFENGNELKISNNKSIDIELAGYRPADGYSLYYLENNQSWTTTDTFENKENTRKNTQLEKLALATPIPEKSQDSGFIFSIDADVNEKPELKPFINQTWELAEKVDETKLERALRSVWSIANIVLINKRKMEYRITFTADLYIEDDKKLNESFSIIAKPVFDKGMSKKEQREEMERKMEEYATLEKQRIEELDRVKKQADLVNVFKAYKMGIYNIDKIISEEFIITNVHFDFETELNGKKDEHKVFMILEENNSVIAINRDQWSSMSIPINKRFHFMAVLPNNRIAYIPESQIQNKLNQNRKELTLNSERKSANEYFNSNQTSNSTGN